MTEDTLALDEIPVGVPRRTGLFLFFTNNFRYLFAIPVVAVILFLETHPILTITAGLFTVLGISAFWKSFYLDVAMGMEGHPHHKGWSLYKSGLSAISQLIRSRPAWQMGLLGWSLASTMLVLATWPSLTGNGWFQVTPRIGFDLYWLAYIPVLIWISYRTDHRNSEWLACFWFASAVFYSVCFFIFHELFSFQNWIHLSVLLSWFLFLAATIHYLIRRIAHFRGQVQVLQALTERLRDDRRYTEAFDLRPIQTGPDESLNGIAKLIGKTLLYDRVFILIRDSESDKLFMKGRHGTEVPWPDKGWSISHQSSITGWVASNMKAHLCYDTNHCSLFYNPDESYPCRSELAVPILVDGECVGVIDIESAYAHAFEYSDTRLLWQIANSIGAALSYERFITREINGVYKLLEQASDILVKSNNVDDALKQVAEKIREIFEADLVVLYKHAVSTCVPLAKLILDGNPLSPELPGHSISKDSRVNQLLRQAKNLYIQPNADTDSLLLGPNNGTYNAEEALKVGSTYRFVRREKIKSMIFVKLGWKNDIVGSLFLNYRKKMDFSKRKINSLRAFANVLTMGLVLKRQWQRAAGPLAGPIPLAHSTAEAAFESVSRDFNSIEWKKIKGAENQKLLKKMDAYQQKLDDLRLEWTNLILVEQIQLHHSSMIEPIAHLETKLRSMFPNIHFVWDSREFIDITPDESGEMIYKLIAEGISNALVHARAHRIDIRCEKTLEWVCIHISNNGKLIDPAQAALYNELMNQSYKVNISQKQTGMIALLQDARQWFGAEWEFSRTSNRTVLKVTIPLNINRLLEDGEFDEI